MRRGKSIQHPRRGAVVVLTALLLVILFGMVAFSIDIGYIALTRAQLQRAADGAAHAAALNINQPSLRTQMAIDTAAMMTAGGEPVLLSAGDIQYGMRTVDANGGFAYAWGGPIINCVKVTANRVAGSGQGPLNLFFAPILGNETANVTAEAISAVNPRELCFVVDLSGSMHHDTEPWAIGALNFVSPGMGDAVMDGLWEDLGLEAGGVPYPLPNTAEYRFDFDSRDNIEITLPQLNGRSLNQSISDYASATGAGSSNVYSSGGTIKAKLKYSDINNLFNSSSVTSKFPSSSGLSSYTHTSGTTNQKDMKNLDFIIDKYLPTVMATAKPPVSDSSYRSYYRGYLNYSRGKTSGMGSSNGINGFSNPANSSTASNIASDFKNSSGNGYSSTAMMNDFNSMVNTASYKTYIQFMMDHGYNSKPGLNSDGNSQKTCYTPMSMRWEDDGKPSGDCYRRTDSDGNSRPPREQPCAAVAEAIIAGLKKLKQINANFPDHLKDKVAILVFGDTFITITDPSSGFTADYDYCIQQVIQKCSQSLPNAASNVDGRSGSTNTQAGLAQAKSWLIAQHARREYSQLVTVLFTDGQPNDVTNTPALTDYSSRKVDLDGDGSATDSYYYSTDSSDPKNAALKMVAQMVDNNPPMIVHTVCAGASRDTDITRRMSLLSKGIARDSGGSFYDYTSNLISDFQDLANHRAVSFGIEP